MSESFPFAVFDDVLSANKVFSSHFTDSELSGRAARGLAVITCIDSRIDPLAVLGMSPGDVKILRNAGARVTDDVLRTLILAVYLLGVDRVLIMPHTDCKMAAASEAEIHQAIFNEFDVDTRSVEIRTVDDPMAAVKMDVIRVRSAPLLPSTLHVGGAMYDVKTGRLEPVLA